MSCNIKGECVRLPLWTSSPQESGCLIYDNGFSRRYFVNKVPGNTDKPDAKTGSYSEGFDKLCDLIKFIAGTPSEPQHNAALELFGSIQAYEDCADNHLFDCGQFVTFYDKRAKETFLLESRIDENNQHPDNRDAWKNHGNIGNILKTIFDEETGYRRVIPYWIPCDGPNCASMYKLDDCVVERQLKTGEDECGNPIYDEFIYASLVDKNTDQPSLGAAKDDPTWGGPYNDCEFANRQVAFTQNGGPIKPGGKHELTTTDAFADVFEMVDAEIDECLLDCKKKTVKRFKFVGEFAKDCKDQALNFGAKIASCLDLSEAESKLTQLINELRQYVDSSIETLTNYINEQISNLSEQITIIKNQIDNGVYKDCSDNDIPKGGKVVGCTQMGDGLVFENGKFNVDFPGPPDDQPTVWPAATIRLNPANPEFISGQKLLSQRESETLTGGASIDGESLVMGQDGQYMIHWRPTNAFWGNASSMGTLKAKVLLNGVLEVQIAFRPEWADVKSMLPFTAQNQPGQLDRDRLRHIKTPLTASDKITIETEGENNNHFLTAATISVWKVSDLSN